MSDHIPWQTPPPNPLYEDGIFDGGPYNGLRRPVLRFVDRLGIYADGQPIHWYVKMVSTVNGTPLWRYVGVRATAPRIRKEQP